MFYDPVRESGAAEAEPNAFLAGQRVLAAERRFVDLGADSFWAVCVEYLRAGAAGSAGGEGGAGAGRKGRIDYREVLPPAEFAVFARLRDLRKELAQAEGVPVYTIFTNEQLAEMVRRRAATAADLEGIGKTGCARPVPPFPLTRRSG